MVSGTEECAGCGFEKSSDLVVTDELGAEVWATYVGDGGFYVNNATVYNVLAYYSYQEGELGRR